MGRRILRVSTSHVDRNFFLDLNGNVHHVHEHRVYGHTDDRFIGERINDGDDSLVRPTAPISGRLAVDYHGTIPEVVGRYLPTSQER